ncbi:MAG: TonB-dependent receptor, partial [Vicinamibacterales bacterium]
MSLRQKLTPWLEGYADYLRTQNRGNGATLLGPNSSMLAVNAPNNPFTTVVNVTYPAVVLRAPGFSTLEHDAVHGRFGGEAPGRVASRARLHVGTLRSSSTAAPRRSWSIPMVRPAQRFPYLTAVSTGVLDVMRDLAAHPLNYTPYLLPGLDADNNGDLTSQTGTLRARASSFICPPATSSFPRASKVSARTRNRRCSRWLRLPAPAFSTAGFPASGRHARAFYSEARVPLIAPAEKSQPSRLELQTSVRHDTSSYHTLANALSLNLPSSNGPFPAVDYLNSKVSDTTYLVGLRTAPWRDLTLRASWGTGFLAPSLSQLSPNPVGFGSFSITDPKRGNATSF